MNNHIDAQVKVMYAILFIKEVQISSPHKQNCFVC